MAKPIWTEDDDLDLEREALDLEREAAENEDHMATMSRDFERMESRNRYIRKALAKRQLDPLVAKAIQLAQNLGHALGANEALGNKVKNLATRIKARDELIKQTNDRNLWKIRAEQAEEKLAKKRKRR